MNQFGMLERAIEYIENHLNENIGLRDVSRETGYSYYHMTRLFSSVLGESVGRYIKRRRLYGASERLIHSGQRVMDIALDSGFESSEAFSRAFKAVFGSSPSEYRRAGLDLVVKAKKELTPEDVCHIANNISHSPEILFLEETKVAGIRGTTSISNNRLPGLWEWFLRTHTELHAATGVGYSICETQQTVYTKEGDVAFSVMVGSPVNQFDNLPKTLAVKIIPAGRYPFSPKEEPLQTYLKRINIFMEPGCQQRKRNWTTGTTLKSIRARCSRLTIQTMRLRFVFQ